MTKRAALWMFATVTFALLITENVFSDPVDTVYVPYKGKSVKLGMLIHDLGKPERTIQENDSELNKPILRSTFKGGLIVFTLPEQDIQNIIVRITLSDASLVLSNGLYVGITQKDVIEKLGKPGHAGVFHGRRYLSYFYFTKSNDPEMNLIAYVDKEGTVQELELTLPVD